jgi:glycosyltransferase involved in cell wall biosynthesis
MAIRVLIQQPSLPAYRVPVFRELASRPGLDVTIAHGHQATLPDATAQGFRAVRLPDYPSWSPARLFQWQPLPPWALRGGCDVLVLNWNIRHLSLIPTVLRARARGIPVVLWGHGYSKFDRPLKRLIRWNIARLGASVVLYNHSTADALVRAGIDRERVFAALNAMDQAPIAAAREALLADPQRLEDFRQQHALTPRSAGGLTLAFVSRLFPENHTEVLIRAAAILHRRGVRTRVMIVGTGPDERRLRSIAARETPAGCVSFHGAIYTQQDIAPFMLAADFFVYPSNVGLSILHAMGYGLPVVVGDRVEQHNPEIEALRPAGDMANGLSFRHNDPQDLARVLDEVRTDDSRVQRLRANALFTAQHQFTIARMVDGLDAAIRAAALSANRPATLRTRPAGAPS